jgi:hypothetical protein
MTSSNGAPSFKIFPVKCFSKSSETSVCGGGFVHFHGQRDRRQFRKNSKYFDDSIYFFKNLIHFRWTAERIGVKSHRGDLIFSIKYQRRVDSNNSNFQIIFQTPEVVH